MPRNPAAPSKDDVTVRLVGVFKNLISEGALTPGGRLPAERDLAEEFGVSRSSLRQALKVLQIMGVISQRVGEGAAVTPVDLGLFSRRSFKADGRAGLLPLLGA